MKLYLPFFLALVTASSSAHRMSFKQLKQRPHLHRREPQKSTDSQVKVGSGSDSEDNTFVLNSVHDLIYLANITVGGVEYAVQLDTGSSDLFIKGETYPLINTTETGLMHNLTYAIGWAYGHIAYAPVEFVGISVPRQAFVDAETAENPALGYGAQGIAGLGFTRLSSISNELNKTGSTSGNALLTNLFEANPSEPNFIAFALHRSTQGNDEVEGSFAIGEFEPEYSAISGNAPISTWPIRNPYRWNVLLDAVIVGTRIVPGTTKQPGAPINKAVVLLDSGSSYTYAPPDIVQAIYGNITGARFDAASGYWQVPCAEEINMALQIGGQVFPIHPLDISPKSVSDPNLCRGSFVPQTMGDGWDFDWLIGDNFLRSVYSVYDFGDYDSSGQMGNPYIKLMSIIDPDQASITFHKSRGGTPKQNITFVGLDGISVAPSFFISNDISQTLETIGKYMPAMLAVVAFNALLLIVGAIVWLVIIIRKRRRRAITRQPRARTGTRPTSSVSGTFQPPPHVYEPVSMAFTEDTFVPPSPAFHGFDGKFQPGDRPKSVA